ncbi:pre-mRNA splicing regulator USH1G-like [Haliotis cracherodii]|uniref:pre-mRNA splicing regulator USH1G-like n=1 Tax=Haliotis cracherodii TaxID=6455 RepID=UPI0039EA9313
MSSRYIEAAKDGFTDVLREAQRKDLNAIDEDGMTATHWAASRGMLEALRMIVGRGGDVNKSDYLGFTALHHSARWGHVDIVSYLINWGCNLFALDNDHHSAMDLASLYEKHEVVRLLDNSCSQQQLKNPKIVAKLKEEAMKNADRNIKRYEKLQEEAEKRADKEQRKLNSMNNDFKAPEKKSIFKTLTVKLRGGANAKNRPGPAYGKKYSDMAGLTYGTRTGVAKKVLQKKITNPLFEDSSFKTSEVDGSGKRTVKSMDGVQGIRGASAEVMYMTSRGEHSANEVSSSRPAVYELFDPNKSNLSKSYKSESDLLVDSGVDSYFSDHEDEEDQPGLLYRPGFGQTAFFRKINPAMSTLQSFETGGDRTSGMMNGVNGGFDDQELTNGQGGDADVITARMQDLPWDQDDLENLDDDDEENEYSSLEMFLMSAGLPNYISHFTKERVDLDLLMKMSDVEMKEVGLPFGPRKKLLEAMERRKRVLQTPVDMTDSFL